MTMPAYRTAYDKYISSDCLRFNFFCLCRIRTTCSGCGCRPYVVAAIVFPDHSTGAKTSMDIFTVVKNGLFLLVITVSGYLLTTNGASAAQDSDAEETTNSLPPVQSASNKLYDISQLQALFRYDLMTPVEVEEKVISDEGGVLVLDITYASVNKKKVDAFLVLPSIKRPVPAVIFVHWGFGSRSQFLHESKLLAKTGIGSLLVSAPFGDSKEHFVQTIINLKRAVDLLVADQRVDSTFIGYVGHSWGGTIGGLLAGVENRIRAYVLIAGFPSYAKYARRDDLKLFAGIYYVAHSAPAALMFQFANDDEFVSREDAEQYFEAGGEPKVIRWYDQTSHKFSNESARADRLEWLGKMLN
jgi:dienelactone hydrolase